MPITILDATLRTPATIIDLAEGLAILPQSCTARRVMLDADETIVTVTLCEIGPLLGQDMGMQIYLQ
jgi:hypothetical protein